MSYTYRGGDRPLEGFTIKCGVGRGGFGEVYVAESEGGKYVALKLLTDHSELELRGIAQCLNLKHPNLIHLYDLRTDDRGRYWVVMEYVIGDSLARVLDRHPTGLPVSLAKEWGISLARAVGYLHDKLVVHRDLKPANIFIEDGQVKVGDFGLCKRMLGSGHRSAQSQGVGTVYYMAPEIDKGQYTKAIDIYASGIILYEMLTGSVPFTGDSPLEILHRHLTDAPDLSKVPAVFRPVVEKALEKDPTKRFANMGEFARALEAIPTGEVPKAVSRPVAQPVSPANVRTTPVAIPVSPPAETRGRPSGPLTDEHRGWLTESLGALVAVPIVAALCTAPWLLFSSSVEWPKMAHLFLLTTALSWAVLVAGRFRGKEVDTWGRRGRMLAVGVAVGLFGFWLDGWKMPTGITQDDANVPYAEQYLGGSIRTSKETLETGLWYVLYFGMTCAAFRWWTITDRRRSERVRLFPIIAMAFWGIVLMVLAPKDSATTTGLRIAPLVLSVVTVQLVAPWSPPPPPTPRRYRLRMAHAHG